MADSYPWHILPQSNYKASMEDKDLLNLDVILQRKCFCNLEECLHPLTGEILPVAFGKKDSLKQLSLNILGGCFLLGDEKWHPKDCENDAWQKCPEEFDQIKDSVGYFENYPSLYFSFSKADSIQFSLPRRFGNKALFDSQKDKIIKGYEEGEKFDSNKDYFFKVTIKCHHVPNKANYWHAQAHTLIHTNPEEDVNATKKKYQGDALRIMVENLIPISSISIPKEIPSIPKSLYILP